MNKFQEQLNRCLGPIGRQHLKPKPKTGIEREAEAQLDAIQDEYREFFRE